MIRDFLFPRCAGSRGCSLLLLAMRLLFGLLLLLHGIAKLVNYVDLSPSFPDPLGIGGQLSMILVVFAELCCSVAFIFGLLYRLALIPMIIAMAVAFVGVHHGALADGELAFIYLMAFIILYWAGPGRYSIDAWLRRALIRRDEYAEEA